MSNRLDQPTDADGPGEPRTRTRARDVARDEGVSNLQALQRVLYRSAKQDPTRRFHALYDKLTRSDVMWAAWISVVTNHGAPGVDGVSIDSVDRRGDGRSADPSSTRSPQRWRRSSIAPNPCDG